MTRGTVIVLATLALTATLLTGCVKLDAGGEPSAAGHAAAEATGPPEDSAREPEDANATRAAVTSRNHSHDYWNGETEMVVYDETNVFFPVPVQPHGEGTTPASSVLVKLPPPRLVLEGTSTIRVRVDRPVAPGAEDPAPPGLVMRYRTAADAEWRDPVPVTPGEALALAVAPHETDLPHSAASLWAFEFFTDRPDVLWLDVNVTIVKGRDVPERPGHPDAYASTPSRVILDAHVTTHRADGKEYLLHGTKSTWLNPALPVAPGTRAVHAFVNVTRVESMSAARASGFALEYHNATILDEEERVTGRVEDANATSEGRGLHFVITPDPRGLDGPYANASRWGFRLVATFDEVHVPGVAYARVCGGCFEYEVEYDVKIVALGPQAADP